MRVLRVATLLLLGTLTLRLRLTPTLGSFGFRLPCRFSLRRRLTLPCGLGFGGGLAVPCLFGLLRLTSRSGFRGLPGCFVLPAALGFLGGLSLPRLLRLRLTLRFLGPQATAFAGIFFLRLAGSLGLCRLPRGFSLASLTCLFAFPAA